MSYIKPWSDIFIKYLFGTPGNNDILLSFINAVLMSKGYDRIVKVEVKNPFNIKEFTLDKESILDVKAHDENGRLYDIEVQSDEQGYYVARSLYYWSTVYSSQLNEAEIYSKLTPVISINLLNFILLEKIEHFHTLFVLQEKDLHLTLTDHLSIHYIELPKLHAVHSTLEKFLYFIKYESKGDSMLDTLIKEDTILQKAHEQYEKFCSDEQLRDLYLRREMYQRDKLSAIEYAEQRGIEKGIEQGIEQGIEKGIEKGMREKALLDARKMRLSGLALELISDITGLSVEEIKSL